MNYSEAKKEMREAGWENPSDLMIKVYSYMGNEQFMSLMEHSVLYADLEAQYFSKKLGYEIKKDSVLYRQLQLSRREIICKTVLDAILAVQKQNHEEMEIEFFACSEEELIKIIEEQNKRRNIRNYIDKLQKSFKEREGGDREFGPL